MPRIPVTARHDCCLPVTLYESACVLLSSGKVLITGGAVGGAAVRNCYLYDPATNTVAVTGSLPAAKKFHKVVRMTLNGVESVLAVGPGDAASTTSQAVYNVVTGVWSSTTSNVATANQCAAVLLPTGGVLVSCGEGASKACDIFSSAGVWTTVASMNAGRRDNGLFVLPSGKVLATPCGAVKTSELYDIGLNSWAYSGSTTNTHNGALFTQLQNGNVVCGPSTGTSCELYDAALGTWSVSGSFAAVRSRYAMATVSGNRALVVGGYLTGLVSTNLVELYSGGTCVRMSNMSYTRAYPALVALADGTFVVVGGYGSATAASTLERYNPANNSWTDLSSIGRVAA